MEDTREVFDWRQPWVVSGISLLAGMAVGLLIAPRSGRSSRQWIVATMRHLRRRVDRLGRDLETQARYERGRILGVVEEMRKASEPPRDVDDETITQRVRTGLGENVATWKLPRLNVNTVGKVVTIRGHVKTEDQKRQAEDVVRSIRGVANVMNLITCEQTGTV